MLPAARLAITALSIVTPIGLAIWDRRSRRTQFIEDTLYRAGMTGEYTKSEIQQFCKEFDIPYPPIQKYSGFPTEEALSSINEKAKETKKLRTQSSTKSVHESGVE